MKDEIKEILDIFKKINEEYSLDTELDFEDYEIPNMYLKQLLDYITNLQQETEFLKLSNPKMNIEHFRIIKENKRKIDILRKEHERLTQGTTVLTNKIIDMTKEIERLTAESTEWESKCYKYQDIIDELERSILKKLEAYKTDKDYFIDNKTMEDLYIELKALKEGK